MARCTANGVIHERNRWRTMRDMQLFRRLQQITKPDKLACFLWVAGDETRGTLFRDGIDRCNALGYAAIEREGGWWDVVPIDRGRVPRQLSDGAEFMGDPPEEIVGTIHDDVIMETKTGGLVAKDKKTGRFKKVEIPKKKKSIYSRKLRTKRRCHE